MVSIARDSQKRNNFGLPVGSLIKIYVHCVPQKRDGLYLTVTLSNVNKLKNNFCIILIVN